MKVKDLIEELKNMDPEMEVILQKDSEGNGFSPCAGADNNAIYIAETTWYGTVYDADWTADECCMSQEEWDELQEFPRVCVLHPVN